MAIDAIYSGTPGTAAQSAQDQINTTKDQFLKLLLVQLQQQDPFDTTDPQELANQITQFGQLEQMFNMNDTLDSINGLQMQSERSQATALIGKTVDAENNQLEVDGSNKGKIGFHLGQDAEKVTVTLRDLFGVPVRTIEFDQQSEGSNFYEFDGKNNEGEDLRDGIYTYEVAAKSSNGTPVPVSTIFSGVVTGVDFTGNGTFVNIGDARFTMDSIISIRGTEIAPLDEEENSEI